MGVQPSCSTPPEGSEPPGAGEAGPHLLRAGGGGGGVRSRAHWGPCSPSPGLGCSPPLPALGTCGAPSPLPWQCHRPQTHHPRSGPQTWDRPRPAANPPSRALRGPIQGCHRGPRLLLSTRAPRSSAAQGPASRLSRLLPPFLSCSWEFSALFFFLRDFFFFFLRCVRAVAWRRRSYSTASLSVAIPSSLSFKSLRPRLRGRGRARPEDARRVLKPFQRLVPGQDQIGRAHV